MMQHIELEHRFVELIPESLEPGVLYIAMDYGIATHACACGCGEEIVTPFTPTDWAMTYDGETVSLWPSIGSWTLPCRSHYIVRRGKVIEAEPWSEDQVENARRREKEAKAQFYGTRPADRPVVSPPPLAPRSPSRWTRVKSWFGF